MSYQINNIWNFNISFDLNKNVSLESVSFSKWIKLQKKKNTDLFLKTDHYRQISLSLSTIRILGCECEILF